MLTLVCRYARIGLTLSFVSVDACADAVLTPRISTLASYTRRGTDNDVARLKFWTRRCVHVMNTVRASARLTRVLLATTAAAAPTVRLYVAGSQSVEQRKLNNFS